MGQDKTFRHNSRLREALLTDNNPASYSEDEFQLPWMERIIIVASYGLSTLLSYSLMLVVMTFNGGLFLACVFGLAFGYFVFGYMRKKGRSAQLAAVGG